MSIFNFLGIGVSEHAIQEIAELEATVGTHKIVDDIGARSEFMQFKNDANRRINRLMLVNQALWSLLEEKVGLTEQQLADRITEIDLKDGKLDGAYVKPAEPCPNCDAKICSQFDHCLFCGYKVKSSPLSK